MSTSYLAIPNDIDFNLSALFGMIAGYVSVPGYQKTNGGLKTSLMEKVSKSPKTFNRAWKGLYQAGYLKRVRMPKQCKIEIGFGENERFYDFYQLFSSPVTDVPSVRNMTIAQGRSFLHRSPAHYQGAIENYTGVSRTAFFSFLMGDRLVSWQYCSYNAPRNPTQFLPTNIGRLPDKYIID